MLAIQEKIIHNVELLNVKLYKRPNELFNFGNIDYFFSCFFIRMWLDFLV